MSKFKVGDRVVAMKPIDGQLPNGVGVVTSVDNHTCVHFPHWRGGHSGETRDANISGHWYYPNETDCLELATQSQESTPSIYRELAEIASYYGVDIRVETGDSVITVTSKTKHQED